MKPDDEDIDEYKYYQEPPMTEWKSEEELRYIARIQEAIDRVKGKEVASSLSGEKGYILKTTDGHHIICYMNEDHLELITGAGEPAASMMHLIGTALPSASELSPSDSNQFDDNRPSISKELQRSHHRTIDGAAIGGRSFNICFPEGVELENMILESSEGVLNLKVFWEQW
ncbi:MAG: hypothetical protein AB9903_24990 [Vulcanimicrobiota bacterium]